MIHADTPSLKEESVFFGINKKGFSGPSQAIAAKKNLAKKKTSPQVEKIQPDHQIVYMISSGASYCRHADIREWLF
jgi:hypothetical protein